MLVRIPDMLVCINPAMVSRIEPFYYEEEGINGSEIFMSDGHREFSKCSIQEIVEMINSVPN